MRILRSNDRLAFGPMAFAVAISVSVAVTIALGIATAPASGAGDFGDLFFPLALSNFAGPYRQAPTAVPPTATQPPPSRTAAPTATGTATPTEGPSATPTLPGEAVSHSAGAGTIILQIGWTATDQAGEVWEEMNGTPYFTLYGDGRLIAGHELLDRKQNLYVGQVEEYFIQRWLRTLKYGVDFGSLKEVYENPRGSKPIIHVYSDSGAGRNRVEIRGFRNWEDHDAPGEPDQQRVKALAALVRDMEAHVTARLLEPYDAEWYTILAQRTHPQMLPDPPRWQGPVSPFAIAFAAPTAASNYVDKVVGHKFVDADLGKEVKDIVVPVADSTWVFYNRAAEFTAGGRSHAVGARQEVPGGSLFLPRDKYDFWYRSDAGSGRPPYPFASPIGERLEWRYDPLFRDRLPSRLQQRE